MRVYAIYGLRTELDLQSGHGEMPNSLREKERERERDPRSVMMRYKRVELGEESFHVISSILLYSFSINSSPC